MMPLSIFNDSSKPVRTKATVLTLSLVAANLGVWAWAWWVFYGNPLLLGTAFLAYGFGLRHAVDADHIAAIDNVTRQLMQAGNRPVAVGFFFSLGHSTVVVLMSIGIVLATSVIQGHLGVIQSIGAVLGTVVSAGFLFVIALVNAMILGKLWQKFREIRAGQALEAEELTGWLTGGGLLSRIFRPLFHWITCSIWMFPLGFLFGLGFDTASEVGLLGVSASQTAQGLPMGSILIFPALFTVGMALIDTMDGILMLNAYGWAFIEPVRKLYYNMAITFLSVIVAVFVGGIETLSLLGIQLERSGAFWDGMTRLADHFGTIGLAVMSVFAFGWLASVRMDRGRGYGRSGQREIG